MSKTPLYFLEFMEEYDLFKKHLAKECFKYDFAADAFDIRKLNVEKSYEDFYITGIDIYKAFEAGRRSKEREDE